MKFVSESLNSVWIVKQAWRQILLVPKGNQYSLQKKIHNSFLSLFLTKTEPRSSFRKLRRLAILEWLEIASQEQRQTKRQESWQKLTLPTLERDRPEHFHAGWVSPETLLPLKAYISILKFYHHLYQGSIWINNMKQKPHFVVKYILMLLNNFCI